MAKRKTKPFRMYEVTMRRDVRQVRVVSVEARTRQEAHDTARCIFGGWQTEEVIGTHDAEIRALAPDRAALEGK